jgi:thymidine kinase
MFAHNFAMVWDDPLTEIRAVCARCKQQAFLVQLGDFR